LITAPRAHLHVAGNSHPGMSGKNNEDRYGVSAYWLDENQQIPVLLTVVADGIGGHRAGEVAAEIAVDTISQVVSASSLRDPIGTLRQAIIQASHEIYKQAESDEQQRGMGATCACALIISDQLYTASVGDSRIYLLRDQEIKQISIDHTWVQEALDQGALTPEQARGHPNSHVIRRYLGSRQEVVPDFRLRSQPDEEDSQSESNQGLQLKTGDRLLLCSDGLTDLVTETEILETLNAHPQEAAVEQLIDLANQRGGHDNITVVSLEMPALQAAAAAPPAPPGRRSAPVKRRRLQWACLGASILALAATLVLAGAVVIFMPAIIDALNPTSTPGEFPQPPAVLPIQTRVPSPSPDLLATAEPASPTAPASATPTSRVTTPTSTNPPRLRPSLTPTP
jgi:PPM family protein phosphatase